MAKINLNNFILLIFIINFVHTHHTFVIHWNQTTFKSYQDGSLISEVHLGDAMDLICPFYDEQQSYMTSELEQYDIYRVTENEYEKCQLNQINPDPMTRRVITCNSPYDVMKYTLNFRAYLPIPNGFEFRANKTYYFLSTSLSHSQCNKLQIRVHDYNRVIISTSTKSSLNHQERKPVSFPHYTHRHTDRIGHHRTFSHVIKAQRHSDPYSIKWITEGPNSNTDTDKSFRTTDSMQTSVSSSNVLSLALSSSSRELSISFICLLLSLVLSLR